MFDPDKKFNPTEHENRAAIDALKAEVAHNPYAAYHSARVGDVPWGREAGHNYTVKAYRKDDGQDCTIAHFVYDHFDGGKRRNDAREMAESLARQINNQSVGK